AAITARAMLRVGERHYDEAWQDLLACHRLGRHLQRAATLIDQLVGIAIEAIASGAELSFVEHAKLDSKQLQKCLQDLEALPPRHSVGDTLDLAERCMLLDLVMSLDRRGPGYLNTVLGGDAGLGSQAERLKGQVNWDPCLRLSNAYYDRLVAA